MTEGEFFKKLLADLDLSLPQFARLAGRTERNIRDWVTAEKLPNGAYELIGDSLKIHWMMIRGAMRGTFDLPAELRSSQELERRLAFPAHADKTIQLTEPLPAIPGKIVRQAAKKGSK